MNFVCAYLSLFQPLKFCLGNSCFIVKLKNTTIMLDCGLELGSLLSFVPLTKHKQLDSEPPLKKQKIR